MSPATRKVRGGRRRRVRPALEAATFFEQRCFEAQDSSVTRLPAGFLLRGQPSRDPTSQVARLADEFVKLNRNALRELDLSVEPHYRSSAIELDVHAGTQIGAVPLISPSSGRHDYGLVVRPRFAGRG